MAIIQLHQLKGEKHMTKYGYCRSARNSENLEEQKQLLQNQMCDEIFTEVVSGLGEKPVLEELLGKIKEGDTLSVTKLDRLSRNTEEVRIILNRLIKQGAEFQTLNARIKEQKDIDLLFVVKDLLAKMEYTQFLNRISEGKRAAKERRLREQS